MAQSWLGDDLVVPSLEAWLQMSLMVGAIGTYGVALLAKAHGIPFYVAAPSSTFDLTLASGDAIPIEQRDPSEVTHGFGKQTAPDGVDIYNPAFDVTPAELVTAIITENGIVTPPYFEGLRRVTK